MKYIVDNDVIYSGFTIVLQNLVSRRIEEVLGENVQNKEDLLDYVHAFGDSIGIVPVGGLRDVLRNTESR